MSPRVTLVKLGGSLITDKARPRTPRPAVLRRLAAELGTARHRDPQRSLVLGHGSGSFGHPAATTHCLAEGISAADQLPGIGRTQAAARELHGLVVDALLEADALPFSLPPSAFLVADEGRPVQVELEPLGRALALGLLPVVCGDVVLDRSRGAGICSTETVFGTLVRELPRYDLQVDRVLWLGDTAGLLDAAGQTVARITAAELDRVAEALGEPRGEDVTGGIRHRLTTALELAHQGVPSLIASGLQPGTLERALAGAEVHGTLVVP